RRSLRPRGRRRRLRRRRGCHRRRARSCSPGSRAAPTGPSPGWGCRWCAAPPPPGPGTRNAASPGPAASWTPRWSRWCSSPRHRSGPRGTADAAWSRGRCHPSVARPWRSRGARGPSDRRGRRPKPPGLPPGRASRASRAVRRAERPGACGGWGRAVPGARPDATGQGAPGAGRGHGLRGSSTAPSRSVAVALSSPQPPYEQVRREIIEQVRTGELTPGDKLPAIRTHAADLGLAAGTVARAYKLLEESRIIVTRRGAGTTIAPGAAAEARRLAEAAQREAGGPVDAGLAALFAGPIAAARARGARDVEILASVRAALAGESGGGPA